MPASRGFLPRRDQVIAACLVGAVVVVVGYASGLGLKPGVVAAGGPPAAVPGGKRPGAPVTPGNQPAPGTQLPPENQLPPIDAVQPMPPAPGPGNSGGPVPGPVGVVVPPATQPPAGSPAPPGTTPPPSPPPLPLPTPGTPLPPCKPGVVQPVLDTLGGLPLLGSLVAGLGVTGPNGLPAQLLGYCQLPTGAIVPLFAATAPGGG